MIPPPHCGSEQLYTPDDASCPNREQFPELKADLYAKLSPIASSVARGAAEHLDALPASNEEPIIELAQALNDTFDSLYLSVDAVPPEAAACPHYQNVEHTVRPGIHTAVAAIDLLMTALDLDGQAQHYQKATRLLQRIALLHADSLPSALNQLCSMLATNVPTITYDNSRLEFSNEFASFLAQQEASTVDKTRLGCPIMFDAVALRELWSAYGRRYTASYNITEATP